MDIVCQAKYRNSHGLYGQKLAIAENNIHAVGIVLQGPIQIGDHQKVGTNGSGRQSCGLLGCGTKPQPARAQILSGGLRDLNGVYRYRRRCGHLAGNTAHQDPMSLILPGDIHGHIPGDDGLTGKDRAFSFTVRHFYLAFFACTVSTAGSINIQAGFMKRLHDGHTGIGDQLRAGRLKNHLHASATSLKRKQAT